MHTIPIRIGIFTAFSPAFSISGLSLKIPAFHRSKYLLSPETVFPAIRKAIRPRFMRTGFRQLCLNQLTDGGYFLFCYGFSWLPAAI